MDVASLGLDEALSAFADTALFTLKGLAYLNLRLGDLEDAHLLLGELRRLDPGDRVGGALLAHVLERHEQGEESGLDGTPPAYPARGWDGAPR